MSIEYGSQAEFVQDVQEEAGARARKIQSSLREAFSAFIQLKELEVISFADMSARDLAKQIQQFPEILKPLLLVCNIAARAIERDLGIKGVDTYAPRLVQESAQTIAGYIKPFLPPLVPLESLCELDRTAFVDKEIRKRKGRWEKRVLTALNDVSGRTFRKRQFKVSGLPFELDAAYPATGDIKIGVDVKRIEARRDIHKRCDEIVNKAQKLKAVSPDARFAAVIYYPFVAEHVNVSDRLRSPAIDSIVFAGEREESIRSAVRMLLAKVGMQ